MFRFIVNLVSIKVILGALLPIFVVLAWEIISASSPGAYNVLSSPYAVVSSLGTSIAQSEFWIDILASLARALGGWAVATLIAAPLGIAMARHRMLHSIVGPALNVLRPISPVAWIPVAILWFGIGYGSKIFIVGLISFFVVLANTFQAAASIDPKLLKAARTLTKSKLRIALHVVIPASARGVATGAQFALASAWGGVIIAEYTGANSGVGYQMLRAANLFLPAKVMTGMLIIGVVGYLLNASFKIATSTRIGTKYLG